MASRPRAGRGTAGRDSSKEVDVEADLLARVIEGLRKAKEQNERAQEIGAEIMALEEEMKSDGGKCFSIVISYTKDYFLLVCSDLLLGILRMMKVTLRTCFAMRLLKYCWSSF